MADVLQLVPFEDAQDKSAQIFSAASRFRESRDHPLLGKSRLHLNPLPAPFAYFISALRMFGDDPFQSLFPGDVVKQDTFFRYMIAESYLRGRGEDFFQEF